MTFFVTLIALAIERFFDCSHLRNWSWFRPYESWVTSRLPASYGYLGLGVVILPFLLAMLLVELLLADTLYGLMDLFVDLAVLLYCLGPVNLWVSAMVASNQPESAVKLEGSANRFFIDANNRLFSVLFWYALTGPVIVVLYRLLIAIAETKPVEENGLIQTSINAFNWPPARLMTLMFALGGHYVEVIRAWRQYATGGLKTNDLLLADCGQAAIQNDDAKPIITVEKSAISLIDRVLVIWLVLVAIGVAIF